MKYLLSLLAGLIISTQTMAAISMQIGYADQDVHMYTCHVVREWCSEDGGKKFYKLKEALMKSVEGSDKFSSIEIIDMVLYDGQYYITYRFY
jgi:replication-associated recombination protein RarA